MGNSASTKNASNFNKKGLVIILISKNFPTKNFKIPRKAGDFLIKDSFYKEPLILSNIFLTVV